MLNVTLSHHDTEIMWWEHQLQAAVEGKTHFAFDNQYGADLDNIEQGLETIIKESKLPLKQVPDLSVYRPGEDCELTHKLSQVYTNLEKDTVVVFDTYKTYVTLRVWSAKQSTAKEYCDRLIMSVPMRDPPDPREDVIPMAFWQHDENQGASCSIRDIQCPSIDEIGGNYPKEVLNSIKELGSLKTPDELGKILIFHGPPGSGKTHMVRALGREWANEADSTVELVIDPELMLNSPAYIRGILLNGDKAAEARRTINRRKGLKISEKRVAGEKPLRLIIIEDSAELFSSDCRSTPGFSRLLNVTDGIIGQGLRCVFLLTANEELGKIDPAIKRPGRCIQCLNFPALPVNQANEWLAANNCKQRVKNDTMLADLYGMKSAKVRKELLAPQEKFGFVPAVAK